MVVAITISATSSVSSRSRHSTTITIRLNAGGITRAKFHRRRSPACSEAVKLALTNVTIDAPKTMRYPLVTVGCPWPSTGASRTPATSAITPVATIMARDVAT